MKPTLAILFLLFSVICYSQSETYPCKFQIVDSRTKAPIVHALVTVDQTGLRTIPTDDDGFCDFKTVPVGRIDVTISHENYISQRVQRTVSPDIKNNTYIIELVPFSENSLLVIGKVTNTDDQNFEGVNVEIKVDGKPYNTVTDFSGNYRFDITSSSIRSDRVQIEFKKDKCKISEELIIPEKRIITKDVKLNCKKGNAVTGDISDLTGVWEFTIFSDYMLAEAGPQKVGYFIGGMLNLTQKGKSITGKFSARNWTMDCKSASISGLINSDNSIEMTFICTAGSCSGDAGIKLTGQFVNGTFVGKVEPTQNPTGKCRLYIGKVELKRS